MSSRKRDAPGVSSAMTADTRGSPDAAGTTAGATCGVQRIIVAQSLHLEGCGACLSMPSGQQGMSAIIADISVSVAACAYEGATTGAATRPAATSHASIRRRIQRPLMRVMVPQTVPVWKPLIVTKATAKSAVNQRGTSVPNPKFARLCSALRANFGFDKDTSKFMILVSFMDQKFARWTCGGDGTNL